MRSAIELAVLSATCAYACAAIYGRRFQLLDPVVVCTGMLCASTVMILPVALIIEQHGQLTPDAATLPALIGLAATSTALGLHHLFPCPDSLPVPPTSCW